MKTENYKPFYIGSDYMEHVLSYNSLSDVIDDLVRLIKRSKIEFDSIAVRGNSGTLVAGPLSLELQKNIILVRKQDGSHSEYDIEGFCSFKNEQSIILNADNLPEIRYIIIDDLIATGKTVLEINEKLKDKAQLVGIFLYAQDMDYKSSIAGIESELDVPVFSIER